MQVVATKRFRDLKAEVIREEGEKFDVSKKRFESLQGTPYGDLVAPTAETPEAEPEGTNAQAGASNSDADGTETPEDESEKDKTA